MNVFELLLNPDLWFGVLRSTTPILFAALAALVSQRCGITNMAIEGIMLFGALFAVIGSWLTQNVWLGLALSILVCVGLTLVLAYFKMKMDADEIMVAIALNLLASGATVFILYLISDSKSVSSALKSGVFPNVTLPLIKDIPFLGRIISGQSILVYVAFIAVFLVHYLLFKTPLGLRIRSVGGNAHAAESVGVSVTKTRYLAMILSGVLTGFAGAFMSMGYLTVFTKGMVSGRGYIALAASYVGGTAPIGTLFASVLFGFFDQLGNQLQAVSQIPSEFIYMIPYLATIVMYSLYTYRKKTAKRRVLQKVVVDHVDPESQTSKELES
ncbi:ABC transporter permease [Vaginisenegalia massiliensis]|uniref:ABC transporter permease n=1 Tax=Vaginisenegalia massiliensis TaxID=2058294 RepID=UPI000F522DB4|nr:ABC transporter permease [Vaginisenegalia massiliensis]